jgi:methionyl-tRNA formyltransferase
VAAVRLVFMGTPEYAVASLRALADERYEILAVVTRPDRPRRHSTSPPAPSPVKIEAARIGLPVLQPESLRDSDFQRRLAALGTDVAVVVAYGQILPPEVLAIPPRWCINVHASLLPHYRGAAPIPRAIMAGESTTGVTTMKMDRGLDTGDILMQKECSIGPEETAGELTARLALLGAAVLVETLRLHARAALVPRHQESGVFRPAPLLVREDGRIDWHANAEAIARRIRGCNPWPLGRTTLRGEVLQILRATPTPEWSGPGGQPAPPGRVLSVEAGRIGVCCGEGTRIDLIEVRFPGRRAMSARDAVNGRLVRLGDDFAPTAGE